MSQPVEEHDTDAAIAAAREAVARRLAREPMPMSPHAFERNPSEPESCRQCGGAWEDHHHGVRPPVGFDEPEDEE